MVERKILKDKGLIMRALLTVTMVYFHFVADANAQLVLPGAVPIQNKPAKAAAAKSGARKPARASALKVPDTDSIVGQDLSLNGNKGRMIFTREKEGLVVTTLTLEGAQISKPDDACRIDVVAGRSITAKPLGQLSGAPRFEFELAACPIQFDVLDGAVFVAAVHAACQFAAADCKVEAAGLWGPRGNSFTPARIKEIERARTHAESRMRENFRELLGRTKGREAVKAAASDQAGFTSSRAQICQDYAREEVHGFCALRITEARALALKVIIGETSRDNLDKKAEQKKKTRAIAVPM